MRYPMHNFDYIPFQECYKHISSELSQDEVIDSLVELQILLPNGKPRDIHLACGTFVYLPDYQGEEALFVKRSDLGAIASRVYQLNKKENEKIDDNS